MKAIGWCLYSQVSCVIQWILLLGCAAEWRSPRTTQLSVDVLQADGEVRPLLVQFDVLLDPPERVAESFCNHVPEACTSNQVEKLVSACADLVNGFSGGRGLYDEVEAQLLDRVGPGPDWLSAADSTCDTEVLVRREEVRLMYLEGSLASRSAGCGPGPRPEADAALGRCPLREARTVYESSPWREDSGQASQLWVDVGRAMFEAREMDYSKAAFLRAVRLGGLDVAQRVEADEYLATIMQQQGSLDIATKLYVRILQEPSTSPSRGLAITIKALTMVPPIAPPTAGDIDAFRKDMLAGLERLLQHLEAEAPHRPPEDHLLDPLRDIGRTPFHLAHQGLDDGDIQATMARVYRVAAPSLNFVAPHLAAQAPLSPAPGPLRVGFLSLNLRDHSIGRMLALPIVTMAAMDSLEVHVFWLSKDGMPSNDPVENLLRERVQHCHTLPLDLEGAAAVVTAQRPDVLVYTDVGMDAFTYFLSFMRLARVQCVWWGHPVTPGSGQIDYFMSLEGEVTDAQTHYAEQLVRMRHVNSAPFQQKIKPTGPGSGTPLPSTFGLPDDAHIYMVLGRLFKLHPAFDPLVLGVLQADPLGYAVLIHEKLEERWTRAVFQRMHKAFSVHGVQDRLRIIHHWNYPSMLANAHVVLDTYPYGGCLTFLEAVAAGVPVVTWPSEQVRGRFSMALYLQMGFTNLIADGAESYIRLAAAVGTNTTYREQLKDHIVDGYGNRLHRVTEVAEEWASMFSALAM